MSRVWVSFWDGALADAELSTEERRATSAGEAGCGRISRRPSGLAS